MIDLTPLDVRKKRGDFSNKLRGYDPQEVDTFLEDVAARLEELVKENLRFQDRTEMLQERVDASDGREKAVQEALVTAQELRSDVKEQARREAELIEREARARIDALVVEAEKHLKERMGALEGLERQRSKFLKAFRTFLEREMDSVEVEEGRAPLEDTTVDLDLGGVWDAASASVGAPEHEGDPDDSSGNSPESAAPENASSEEAPESSTDDSPEASSDDSPQEPDGGKETPPDSSALWLYDLDEGGEGRG